jgi:uncharacterized protein
MPFGLSPFVCSKISGALGTEPKLRRVRIFGSRAKGNYKPSSDVDLAVFAPDLSFRELLELRSKLDDLPCIFSLDTVHFDSLENERLKDSILRDGVDWPDFIPKQS